MTTPTNRKPAPVKMRSFQERVLAEIVSIAGKHGGEAVQAAGAANAGRILVQQKNPAFGTGPIKTVAYLDYHFQPGHNKIMFNGAPMGPTDMTWLFGETEDDKINGMLRTWSTVVQIGRRDGLVELGRKK
jgi:hypothetical protein